MALKYGRRPPKNAPALQLSQFLRAGVTTPPHPATDDVTGSMSGWEMLGNDAAGDCEAVRWANDRRVQTTLLSGKPNYPTQAQVWQVYQTQNPGFVPGNGPHGYGSDDDQGMDTQTLCEYLVAHGGPDGVKALAFAKVDLTNVAETDAADAIFGGLWFDITVLDANQDDFAQGKPWDYHAGSQVDGGHAVKGVGYIDETGRKRFLTWARETSMTAAFFKKQVDEAWVVIWPEIVGTAGFQAGIDQAALVAAYSAITNGKVLVLPSVNPPVTPPSGGGASFPGSSALVDQHVAKAAARAKLSVPAYMEHIMEVRYDLPPQGN